MIGKTELEQQEWWSDPELQGWNITVRTFDHHYFSLYPYEKEHFFQCLIENIIQIILLCLWSPRNSLLS